METYFFSIQIFPRSIKHGKITKSTNIWATEKRNITNEKSWKDLYNGIFVETSAETITVKNLKLSPECGMSMKKIRY